MSLIKWNLKHKHNRRYNAKRLSKTDFDKRCLICCDLDGTLLNKDCVIPEYTRKVIKALSKKGHEFCICTARPRRSSYNYYAALKLDTPLVNYNGARIHNPSDKDFEQLNFRINTEIVYKIFSNSKVQKMIKNVLLETPDGSFFLKDIEKKYSREDLIKSLAKFNVYTTDDISYVSDDFTKLRSGVWSILVALEDMSKAVEFSELVRSLCSSVVVRSWTEEHVGVVIEINSVFPSKGMALRFLSSYYDIPLERCYAFGDNENDVEMLIATKNGYAMKNGNEFAKRAANNITQYINDDQGVARELNRIFKLGVKYSKPKLQFEGKDLKVAK